MALHIRNKEVERLAADVARLANETKTEAVRRALLDRKLRLALHRAAGPKRKSLISILQNRIWPQVPRQVLGRSVSKKEREEILGYGPEGV